MTCKQLVSLISLSSILLTSCKAQASESVSEDEDPVTYEMVEAEWETVKSDCVTLYQLFLKLGSLKEEEVDAILSDATKTKEDSKTTWSYDVGEYDKYSYFQDASNMISNYTRIFPILADDALEWVDYEVKAFDTLMGVEHTEETVEGSYKAYSWDIYLETIKFQVYEVAAETYAAIISFSRQGETYIPPDKVVDERTEES